MAHRRPGAIVLLDEEQQRALQQHDRTMRHRHRNSIPESTRSDPPAPRTDFSSLNEIRTDFTSFGVKGTSPRTNFTTSAAAPPPRAAPAFVRPSDGVASSSEETADQGIYATARSGLRMSIPLILCGIVLGIGLGIGLTTMQVSDVTARWVGLPGELFLRALKCLVIPYVFCSVAVAMGDIVFVGKVSVVGIQTAKTFVLSWISTTVVGMGIALAFRPLFRTNNAFEGARTNAVGFTCANGNRLTMAENGTLVCLLNDQSSVKSSATFVLKDVHDVFKKNEKSVLADLNFSDQLMTMIRSIISPNIVQSMARDDLLAIMTFAMLLGVIAGRQYFTKTRQVNYLYMVLLQLRRTFFVAMEWIIWLTPVAVISIVAGSFASNQKSLRELGNVYLFVVAAIVAACVQMFMLLPSLLFLMTRCNPFKHMRYMIRSYMFAFGTASSLATAPVTLGCLEHARCCSQSLANFVISIGVTSNMSASGWYYPIGIIFLAESSGHGDLLTVGRLTAIFGLSVLACAGTPPIPSAGLVMMTTIYETVFGVHDMPTTFALVMAVDFFVDRICTVCNVNDDIMALKLIAENTDETITNELNSTSTCS